MEQEVGQLGVLLEHLVVLGRLGFGFTANLDRLCAGLGQDLVGLKVSLGLDLRGLALALGLDLLDLRLALGLHALEHGTGNGLRDAKPLDANHDDLDAVVLRVVSDPGFHFFLDFVELQFLLIGAHQVVESVLANHGILGAAHLTL